jgi:hypothetical protein
VHEDEINRLNASIQIGEQLYKNHQLNNNEYDQLVKDIGRRHMLQLDLETLKDGERRF